ncbi:MAG TPA: DnaB-like helicase C-terminal domain-containing protein [Candidatus Azoamicus sp.]
MSEQSFSYDSFKILFLDIKKLIKVNEAEFPYEDIKTLINKTFFYDNTDKKIIELAAYTVEHECYIKTIENAKKFIEKNINYSIINEVNIFLSKETEGPSFNEKEVLGKISDKFLEIKSKNEQSNPTMKLNKLSLICDDMIKKLLSGEDINTTIPTGFKTLDYLLSGGLEKGDLVLIAGRPSTGKSAFALNLILNLLKLEDINLIIYSIEMTSKQIFYKLASISSNLPLAYLKTKKLTKETIDFIEYNLQIFRNKNINVCEESEIDITDLLTFLTYKKNK